MYYSNDFKIKDIRQDPISGNVVIDINLLSRKLRYNLHHFIY